MFEEEQRQHLSWNASSHGKCNSPAGPLFPVGPTGPVGPVPPVPPVGQDMPVEKKSNYPNNGRQGLFEELARLSGLAVRTKRMITIVVTHKMSCT